MDLDLSKVSFEDILTGNDRNPVPDKKVEPPASVEPVKPEPVIVEPPVKDDPTPDDVNLYEKLSQIIGYEIDGEYEESVEGIAEYAREVGKTIAQEELRELFDSIPDVKEYLEYRLNGGAPEKYFEGKFGDIDYSKYQISETDEVTQEIVVRKFLASQGFSEDEVNETIKDYKDTNLLYKTAKTAVNKLVESQRSKKDQVVAEQARKAREDMIERERVITEITEVVDKGTLQNIVIPEKDRKEFRAWMLQVNAKGETKRQEAMRKLSLQEKLELEYLVFKGFNLKDLVAREAAKTRVDFLKKADGKGSKLGKTGVPLKSDPKGGKFNINISDIL